IAEILGRAIELTVHVHSSIRTPRRVAPSRRIYHEERSRVEGSSGRRLPGTQPSPGPTTGTRLELDRGWYFRRPRVDEHLKKMGPVWN
ncbi:MAG TPA: hypothetical protein VMV13_12140, partial [Candidatus Binataceae bacterium]|nr:hypothetical protein [Candidatus Binataceae bacterium]